MKSENSKFGLGTFLIIFGIVVLLISGQELGLLNIGKIAAFVFSTILPIGILYLLVSVLLKRSAKKSSLRGTYGEREVNTILSDLAKKYGGVEFLDLMIKKERYCTQIDNMLLTNKALYVIETKDYSGWIFGSQRNEYWTQTFRSRRGIKKYKFYNPILQNLTHISILRKVIPKLDKLQIYNIIVFTGSGHLKDVKHSEDVYVIYSSGLKYLIKDLESKNVESLQMDEMIDLTNELYRLNTIDYEERQRYISDIRNKHTL